jgi:ubiquitin carboxyl-terminal hydrolase 8
MTGRSNGGILNIGFTCYANAVIQAFRHCETFDTLFQEDNYNTKLNEKSKYCQLTKQFANLLQNLSTMSSSSSIKPMGFWHAFHQVTQGSGFEHLNERRPHDAHEILMFLLDSIHESFAKEIRMNITKIDIKTQRQMLHNNSLEAWKNNFEKSYSPFVPLFFGLSHVQIVCSNCKNITNKFESFNTLKAAMSNDTKLTLIESVLNDLNDEIIDEYACDKCSPIRHNATRKTKLWKLPPTLIIVLKRFTFDGRKIYTPLLPFESPIDLSELYSSLSPDKFIKNKYSLRSIVDHHGGPTGGHYTSQAKNRYDDMWYHYDDQSVGQIDKPEIGSSTYILFLEKV